MIARSGCYALATVSRARSLLAAAMTAALVATLVAALVASPVVPDALRAVVGIAAALAIAYAWLGSSQRVAAATIALAPILAFVGVAVGSCKCEDPRHGDPGAWLALVGGLFVLSVVVLVADRWLERRGPPMPPARIA